MQMRWFLIDMVAPCWNFFLIKISFTWLWIGTISHCIMEVLLTFRRFVVDLFHGITRRILHFSSFSDSNTKNSVISLSSWIKLYKNHWSFDCDWKFSEVSILNSSTLFNVLAVSIFYKIIKIVKYKFK